MNPFVKKWSIKRVLRNGRLTSCMILIALVMAPLVCALIFSESMMDGITNKYIYLSDGHLQLNNSNFTKDISSFDKESFSDYLYSADQVTSGYALMYSSTGTSSVLIKGVDDSYFNEKRLQQLTIERTTADNSGTSVKGITISRSLAKQLNVKMGDRVALMIVPDNPDTVLRPVLVRIDGIFQSGYDQLDKLLCFIDLSYAQTLYSDPSSSVLELLVNAEYMDNLDEVESMISSDFRTTQWSDHNISVYENFITSKQMILIILMLVVVVAAFYTASVAQQMIQDDMQDIAITKLIGNSDSLVKKSAFLSVYSVTIMGMVLGIVLGLIIGFNLGPILSWLSSLGIESLSFYLLDFTITIPWLSIVVISACLLLISYLSIRLALRKTRNITPIRLFTSL